MTVTATPISAAGDAYCSLDEADSYALRIADATVWTAADDATRSAALVQASDEIDTLAFAGGKYSADQAREFPRLVATDPGGAPNPYGTAAGIELEPSTVWELDADNNAIVPELVKRAAFLQAVSILRDPQRAARLRDRHDGVTSVSGGGISEGYDTANPPQLVCMEAMLLLRRYTRKGGRIV